MVSVAVTVVTATSTCEMTISQCSPRCRPWKLPVGVTRREDLWWYQPSCGVVQSFGEREEEIKREGGVGRTLGDGEGCGEDAVVEGWWRVGVKWAEPGVKFWFGPSSSVTCMCA